MLNEILALALKNKCSDIHITSGQHPIVRLGGDLIRVKEFGILTDANIDNMISAVLNEEQLKKFKEKSEIDFAFAIQGNKRFRANAFRTFAGPAIAIRPIEEKIKNLDEIRAPAVVKKILQKRRGLIIVSGPTGSGKSTTLSAMIDYINQTTPCNILTIEDPIEYVHKSNKALISQREVGVHTNSFAQALKSALRENPDIILVGEMRDIETFSLALTAAETGHLVLATLHTSSAANAITRIIDVFPSEEQKMIKTMLANSLNAVVLQRLIKTGERDRCAVFEVMIANSSIRNLIREDKVAQINSMMEMGQKYGMVTMKDSIVALAEEKVISPEAAKNAIDSFA